MTVTLLAYPALTPAALDLLAPDEGTSAADHLHEAAGRSCYRSFHRPNPKTAANADYLANVIAQGHTSVLAHASFTFRLTGVSRSLTHELIRHRFLAVSEVSQRYVNMSESYTVAPPALRERGNAILSGVVENHRDAVKLYDLIVDDLVGSGLGRKQAREAARCVLPGGTETEMIVTGNVRAWRDFVAQRFTVHADAEIREVAGEILAVLREYAPSSVQDFGDAPTG